MLESIKSLLFSYSLLSQHLGVNAEGFTVYSGLVVSGFEVNGVQYGATNSPKRIIELNQGETIDSVVYGRQLGDAPFNSYGWCKNDGQDGSLKYEGPYEQDLDWSRIDEQLEFVTGNDNRQYITGFKPKNYIGCFKDRAQRDLPFQAPENDANGERIWYLPETCTQICRENKYEYAGVQVGGQCFCGNSYGKYGEEPGSACDRPCSDNSEPSRCGGSWTNSIFVTGFDLSAYDDEKCSQIAGTNNIQWTLLSKTENWPEVGCSGVEFTELSEGLDSVFLKGNSVSNSQCIGTDEYTLSRTDDPFIINAITATGVRMTFKREDNQECFTANWISDGYDYMAYVDKYIIPAPTTTISTTTTPMTTTTPTTATTQTTTTADKCTVLTAVESMDSLLDSIKGSFPQRQVSNRVVTQLSYGVWDKKYLLQNREQALKCSKDLNRSVPNSVLKGCKFNAGQNTKESAENICYGMNDLLVWTFSDCQSGTGQGQGRAKGAIRKLSNLCRRFLKKL